MSGWIYMNCRCIMGGWSSIWTTDKYHQWGSGHIRELHTAFPKMFAMQSSKFCFIHLLKIILKMPRALGEL